MRHELQPPPSALVMANEPDRSSPYCETLVAPTLQGLCDSRTSMQVPRWAVAGAIETSRHEQQLSQLAICSV